LDDEGPIEASVRFLGRPVTSFAEVDAFVVRELPWPTEVARGTRLR